MGFRSGAPSCKGDLRRRTLPEQRTQPAPQLPQLERLAVEPVVIIMNGVSMGQVIALEPGRTHFRLGRADDNDVRLLATEVSRFHAELQLDKRWLLRDLNSTNGSYVNGVACEDQCEVALGDTLRLGPYTLLKLADKHDPETVFASEMQRAVLRDSLTGVFNRRYLDEHLDRELAYAKRHASPLALLMADIDHFKRVNDRYGHRVGDAALRYVAKILGETVRAEDVVARYGGEEFAIVCRNTDENDATVLAERLRDAVRDEPCEFEGDVFLVTVSIGVAACPHAPPTPGGLIDAADDALYSAKREGRNCWRAASTRPPAHSGFHPKEPLSKEGAS